MGNIIAFSDLETEGITEPTYDRQRTEQLILAAEQAVETITGRIFRKVDGQVVYANGRGYAELLLKEPVISITSVEVSGEVIASDTYEIVTSLEPEGALRNPKLRKTDNSIWTKGDRNVKISGSFGFVLLDGQDYVAPLLIKRAVMLIVAKTLTPISEKVGASNQSRIVSERLGNYSYTLATDAMGSGFFDDSEIDNIIAGYRRLHMAAV